MPSNLFISLIQSLDKLKSHLITSGKDYNEYTAAEHSQALGFRILASAHLEDYAERRCLDIARIGVERFKTGHPARTGRCLLTWHTVRTGLPIPLQPSECLVDDRIDKAFRAYGRVVEKTHGVSGDKLRGLVLPLGLQEENLDAQLFDKLEILAVPRGAAAHLRINRARQMVPPEQEWHAVQDVIPLLKDLDEILQQLVIN